MNKKVILGLEFAIVSLIFLGVRTLLETKYASQVALVLGLIVITLLIKNRNISWKNLGLAKPESRMRALILPVLCVISIGVIFNFVRQLLFPHGANNITSRQPISPVEMLFQLFFIGILCAAVGEEMSFRGFLPHNLNDIFGKNIIGTASAIIIPAFIFGVLHFGVQCMVSAGTIGLILGVFFVGAGRNLIVVMVALAVPDVLSILLSWQYKL